MNSPSTTSQVKNIVAVFGVPRSGTSWLGQILNSSPQVAYRYQPLFSFEFKDRLNEQSSKEEIVKFHDDLMSASSDFVLQNSDLDGNVGPNFKKSYTDTLVWKEVRYHNIIRNLLTKHAHMKIVGIVRNPKSVINSWYHAPKEFKATEWSILEEWKDAPSKNRGLPEEFNGYNKWKEVTELYVQLSKKYPDRFYLLEYSELLNNTEEEVKKLFKFCSIIYTDQTANFILRSKTTDLSGSAYSVYRSNQTDDKWKTGLPREVVAEIDKDIKGTSLARFVE